MAANRMTATAKAATKTSAAKTVPATRPAPAKKASPAKKAPAKKASPAAKKTASATTTATPKTATPKTAPPKTAPPKTAPPKTAPPKTATTKATVKTAPAAKKTAAHNAAPAKGAPTKAPTARRTTPATTTTKTTAAVPVNRAGTRAAASADAALPRVAKTDKPWTAKELAEIRTELELERSRALTDLQIAEADLQGLLRDAGEGAGDDQADAGASIFGREYEMVLANNSREKLDQIEHALERLANGSYGVCESCGDPIGKIRLQAAPRATLCLACKTRQESR